jgi:phosphohistidine phosphatase SixA
MNPVRFRRNAAIASLLAVLACGQALLQAFPQDRGPVTALIVRHAERAETPAEDPGLTAAGQARASALVDVARKANVTAVITTQLLRTRSTAEPTARALRITPEILNTGDPQHAQNVASAVRTHAGHTVLIVGHSNTIPAIIEALGVKDSAAICEMEYDKIFVVTVTADGAASVTRSTYGARTPMDANCRPASAAR